MNEKKNVFWMTFLSGVITGAVILGLAMVFMMPSMMIVTKASKYDFETTIAKIEENIKQAGWGHKGTGIVSDEIKAKAGIDLGARVATIKLCHPDYAGAILQEPSARFVSCLMPCSIGIWEDSDGTVRISKMNTGLMGRLFGGIIAQVMSGPVSMDVDNMLAPVVGD